MKTSRQRVLTTLMFLCVATVGPKAQAISPPSDGCYPNFTTAEGCDALNFLTTGAGNTGLGWRSLFSDSTGSFNTAVGGGALALNNGNSNTALGAAALLLNTSGSNNTAIGTDALVYNDAGEGNVAVGSQALVVNDIGSDNTAVGTQALSGNIAGFANTATGFQALLNNNGNTGATGNTANGFQALQNNTNGNDNVAIGALALANNMIGSQNTALGTSAGANITGFGNICIRNVGVAGESNTIRIGDIFHERTFIGGIRGVTTGQANAVPVLIDSQGQLGTVSSSRRFKHEIKPMDKTSEAIHALKPVTFQYKSDKTATLQFGLIAEEVAEVNADLVVCDENGEIYTVRYDVVNAMLLNEFLKEHKAFLKEQQKVQKLEVALDAVNQRLKEQEAKIQRVSAQIQMNETAPQLMAGNQ